MIQTHMNIYGIEDNWLDVSTVEVQHLPNNFIYDGSISCDKSKLKDLPEGLTISGNLYIGDSQINELPKNTFIGKDLILLDSSIFDLPQDIGIGGRILSIKTNFIPTYQKNTQYSNYVCCNDGALVSYKQQRIIDRHFVDNFGNWSRPDLIYYKGTFDNINAIATKDNSIILSCGNLHEGIEKIERFLLYHSYIFNKYSEYDLNEPRLVKELKKMYKDITGACAPGIEAFMKEEIKTLDINKYSIMQLIHILKESKIAQNYNYNFLFIDYFLNKEKFK